MVEILFYFILSAVLEYQNNLRSVHISKMKTNVNDLNFACQTFFYVLSFSKIEIIVEKHFRMTIMKHIY